MSIYGDLQKLNQAEKQPKAELLTPASNETSLPVQPPIKEPKKETKPRDTVIPRHHATMTPRYRDTTIESIRTAVKMFGKEAATHRFTLEEKRAIRGIVFAYEGQGIRTNENEISRIGVNYLIEDYRANGESSILHKALKALNG